MRMFLERLRPFAPLSLRLMAGALFILFGAQKVLWGGLPAFQTQVGAWTLPHWLTPHHLALGLGWGALVGGGLVVVGLMTRFAALVLAAILTLLTVKLKLHAPLQGGLDLPLLQLAACISLMLSGAGRFSADRRFFGGP